MTEITNPEPQDPQGASTTNEESLPVNGSQELLDGASTGTDDGPAGIPASLVGQDKAGNEVPPPPAARPGPLERDRGPGEEDDPLSPADTSNPSQVSGGRGDSAAPAQLPQAHEGR